MNAVKKDQKELWELPGWEKNKIATSAMSFAEVWDNLRHGLSAWIQKDEFGEIQIMSLKII